MNPFFTKPVFVFFFLLFSPFLFAQNNSNPWQEVSESQFFTGQERRQIIPKVYKTYQVDLDALKSLLDMAPLWFTPEAEQQEILLYLPFPDGSIQRFRIEKAPVMHPDLAARYPGMMSFAATSLDDPTAYLRCDISPIGFHAMVLSARHSTVFIDPYAVGDTEHYVVYYKKDYERQDGNEFVCHVENEEVTEHHDIHSDTSGGGRNTSSLLIHDCQHRKYRLALACTGEYGQFHGGNVASILAEYNASLSRINGIFEREMAVTLELIANTDDIIYTNPSTDPFSGDNSSMINQNQSNTNSVIGSANYDIGHLYNRGGGGLAQLRSPCGSGKARAISGINNPTGDPFWVDYVCHEMGHQWGGNHTQNNDCNRNSSTSMEPGSGSTMMSYSGICPPNVQNNSDDYYHAVNLAEIDNFIVNGNGNSCPVKTVMGNIKPIVSVPGFSYVIPRSTPFRLTASATDPNGDVMTYCWEQMDPQVATMPPLATNTGGPAFRSFSPVESPTRYFPNIIAILNNTTPEWEVLPAVTRSMNFRCTVRDNHFGGGCRDNVNVSLNVASSAGPFLVTKPNTFMTWDVGSTEEVTWDVASTNQAPVACSLVDILLSIDGGFTYPIILAAGVPNDGSHNITVPDEITSNARVMVACSGNVFFDVSNTNFEIEQSAIPIFLFNVSPFSQELCAQENTVNYVLDLTSVAGFNEPVTFTVTGLPPGAIATFAPNSVVPTGTVVMTIGNLNGSVSGISILNISAISSSMSLSLPAQLILIGGAPEPKALLGPADGEKEVNFNPTLAWNAFPDADIHIVEIATNPAFGSTMVDSLIVLGNTVSTQNINVPGQVYYWRVRGSNDCGIGEYSEIFAFQLAGGNCVDFFSEDTPIPIPSNMAGEYISKIEVEEDFSIIDVNASLDVAHSWVGDLTGELIGPDGDTIQLFDRPGFPTLGSGCSQNDIQATFDDAASNTSDDFENSCNTVPPAIGGAFQPLEPLSIYNGQSGLGEWTLRLVDPFNQDGGVFNSWSLNICREIGPISLDLLRNKVLFVVEGGNRVVSNAYLKAEADSLAPHKISFILLSVPEHGFLTLENSSTGSLDTLKIGAIFTQEEIDQNLLSYHHTNIAAVEDEFHFDVLTTLNEWLHDSIFSINIVQSDLILGNISTIDLECANDPTGQITVEVESGQAPFEYSLDGINFQTENTFDSLSVGAYVVSVRDSFGFTVQSDTIFLEGLPEILASTQVVGDDILVVGAGGGTPPLEFSIDGINFQSDTVFADLPNDTYTVTIRDSFGCILEIETIVDVAQLDVIAEITQGISCTDSADAVVVVTASGGIPPYQYSLDGENFGPSEVFENLAPGLYTFWVEDSEEHIDSTSEIEIINPDPITGSVDVVFNDIVVTASGGTGVLQYSLDGINFQNENIFPDLQNDTYSIYIMDENGCILILEATVEVLPITADLELTQGVSCTDSLDAIITVTAAGGIPPYEYSVDGINFQVSNVFTGLGAGTYIVRILDSEGHLEVFGPVVIANPAPLTAAATVDGNDITVNAGGGTEPYVYSLDGIIFEPENVFVDLPAGDYTITVRDANGCETEVGATITILPLSVELELVQGISCADSTDAILAANGSGGILPYEYSLDGVNFQTSNIFDNLGSGMYMVWIRDSEGDEATSTTVEITNPAPLSAILAIDGNDIFVIGSGGTGILAYSIDGINYSPLPTFDDLPNGTYEIRVRDENGCEIIEVAVIDIPQLDATAEVTQDISCAGAADAVIVIEATGGFPPYEYSLDSINWQPFNDFTDLSAGEYTAYVRDDDGVVFSQGPLTIIDPDPIVASVDVVGNDIVITASGGTGSLEYSVDGINFQPENVFPDLLNGTYTVTIRDANGCETMIEATVEILPLSVELKIIQEINCADSANAILGANGDGGIPPYEYSLDGNTFQSSGVFNDLGPGEYMVWIRDSEGDEATSTTVEIINPAPITASAMVVGNDILVTASGGTGALSYSLDGIDFTPDPNFVDLPNDLYQITVRDENGCEIVIEAEVNVLPLDAIVEVTQGISCAGASDAMIVVEVTGGIPPYEYSLDNVDFQISNEFSDLGPGDYTVYVRDSEGNLISMGQYSILEPDPLTASADVVGNDIVVTAGGGTEPLEYSLDGINFQPGNVFPDQLNNTYTVTVRDANDCTTQVEVIVDVEILLIIAELTQDIDCAGDMDGIITVNASGGIPPYEYSLDGDNYQTSTIFEGLGAGEYTVLVRDSEGNVISSNTVMIVSPPPLFGSAGVTGNDIAVTAGGGTGSLSYSLDGINFQSSPVFEDQDNGFYTIIIQDENGCQIEVEAEVNVLPLAVLTEIIQEISCAGEEDASFEVLANGGIPPYEYSLDGVDYQSSNLFSGLGAGDYMVWLRDSEGNVISSGTIQLSDPAPLVASGLVDANDIIITASGGTGTLQYSLDGVNFQPENVFPDLANGMYTVTIEDENGCQVTVEAEINVAPLIITAEVVNELLCAGDMNGQVVVTASGGIPPLEYSVDGVNFQSSNIFSGLGAGDYEFHVRDSEGNTISATTVSVTEPAPLAASTTVTDMSIEVTASGGVGVLEYSIDGVIFQFNNTFTDLGPGTYIVTVRDENDCTIEVETVIDPTLAIFFTINEITCYDGQNGVIIIDQVFGGVPPYTYSINGADFTDENTYTGLAKGEHVFEVKDATGTIILVQSVFLANPPPIDFEIQAIGSNITILANGGSGDYTYSINGGVSFQPQNVFINVPHGTYTFVVKDEAGCTVSEVFNFGVTATSHPSRGLAFELFPNPNSGKFTIVLDESSEPELTVSVYDVIGKLVFEQEYDKLPDYFEQEVVLSGLASGVYLVRVVSGEKNGVRRVVVY